jgi:hypothetical protein
MLTGIDRILQDVMLKRGQALILMKCTGSLLYVQSDGNTFQNNGERDRNGLRMYAMQYAYTTLLILLAHLKIGNQTA